MEAKSEIPNPAGDAAKEYILSAGDPAEARSKAVEFLRANPLETGEFCLSVMESFQTTDRTTPALLIAGVIEELLGVEAPDIKG